MRAYAREHGLPVADKPASACLASRIPVGTHVTRERLALVESAEERLRALGFRELRVRLWGPLAGVELGSSELQLGRRRWAEIRRALVALGFERVELSAYRDPATRRAAGPSAVAAK